MEFKVGNRYKINLSVLYDNRPMYFEGEIIENTLEFVKMLDKTGKEVNINKNHIVSVQEC